MSLNHSHQGALAFEAASLATQLATSGRRVANPIMRSPWRKRLQFD